MCSPDVDAAPGISQEQKEISFLLNDDKHRKWYLMRLRRTWQRSKNHETSFALESVMIAHFVFHILRPLSQMLSNFHRRPLSVEISLITRRARWAFTMLGNDWKTELGGKTVNEDA